MRRIRATAMSEEDIVHTRDGYLAIHVDILQHEFGDPGRQPPETLRGYVSGTALSQADRKPDPLMVMRRWGDRLEDRAGCDLKTILQDLQRLGLIHELHQRGSYYVFKTNVPPPTAMVH